MLCLSKNKIINNVLLIISCLTLFHFDIIGQSLSPFVITTSGNYVINGGASLSYTIGEPMVQTFYSSKNVLTQGFQQPIDTLAINQDSTQAAINEFSKESAYILNVYPNPFSNYIYVKIDGALNDKFEIYLLNQLGQQCMTSISIDYFGGSNTYKIHTGELSMGIYFLRLKSLNNSFAYSIKLNRTSYY
jgi:hypothetical protein